MESLQQFLDMGGYAAFVWPAIGVTLIVLIALAWSSIARLNQTQRRLDALEAQRRSLRDERRRGNEQHDQ